MKAALGNVNSWFATMWHGGHVGGQNNGIFSWRIYMKIEFSSQRREKLLFLITNMAAVTFHANQQLHTGELLFGGHTRKLWQWVLYAQMPNAQSPIANNQWPKHHLIELCIKPNSIAGLHVTLRPRTKAFLSSLGTKFHFHHLYYYMRNYCNLIGLEQWYFSLIWNTYMWKLQTFAGSSINK